MNFIKEWLRPRKRKRSDIPRSCTEEEFEEFIWTYPRPLTREVSPIWGPQLVMFLDESLGQWPQNIVAWYTFLEVDPMKACSWTIDESRVSETCVTDQ